MVVLNSSDHQGCQRLLISQLIQSRLQREERVLAQSAEAFVPNSAVPNSAVINSGAVQYSGSDINQNYLQLLSSLGLRNVNQIYRNLPAAELVEHALIRGEGLLAANGALCVETGKYTGRSPKDRFLVDEPGSHSAIAWNAINRPLAEDQFERLYQKMLGYVEGRDLYVFDGYVGADPERRFGVRVVNEFAWQNLFVHQLFRRPTPAELATHQADFLVIALPGLCGDPATDGLNSEAFIVLHLTRRIILIGGTHYAGEMKKSIFSLLNYVMPQHHVLPMHGAANIDKEGNTALFFGLSGTGKTSLSADPERFLIGDDEHGWSEAGIFNFEGGCYAKTIRLSQENEPQIWSAIRFGAIVENVVLHPDTRELDYDSDRRTENTRAAYPLDYIPNSVPAGMGTHPKTIIFLTADAFGVLPPIARLTREQAIYHFLSGYTSKLAGTERGVTQPESTFSACFGQVFFPLPPTVYAAMLGDRLQQHPETQVYLINTGWIGGAYGVGHRIPIQYTRAMVSAALRGELDAVAYHPHPIFQVLMPETVPGVLTELLDPKRMWQDAVAYDLQAQKLAQQFIANFQQFGTMPPEIVAAGPQIG
ncbi:MAG: phosphoenolpyruvate carboxykinase (ATP) [Leptolyngbyaceae cyanobacterium bins.349]|nr:phosphoenolpyruvate carboxykinase (ATP) [Leptolyngbyaceae cyanobacterium bins.349]